MQEATAIAIVILLAICSVFLLAEFCDLLWDWGYGR
jgi:hypothetical protein